MPSSSSHGKSARAFYSVAITADPRQRTALESAYAAARMRETGLRRRDQRRVSEAVVTAVDEISKDLSRGDIRVRVSKKKPGKHRSEHKLEIVVTRARKQHKGEQKCIRHGLTAKRSLDIIFHPIHESKKLAKIFDVSARHIKRLKSAASETMLRRERQLLRSPELTNWLCSSPAAAIAGMPPAKRFHFGVSSTAFDETTERLRLFITGNRRLTWHILVVDQHFVFEAVDATGRTSSFWLHCIRPPTPLVHTTAEALYAGMFTLPTARPYAECELHASRPLDIFARHFDRDGASANDKLLEDITAKCADAHTVCQRPLQNLP